MNWQTLGEFTLIEDWQLTVPTQKEIFRVTHLSYPINKDYVLALVAQVFEVDEIISIFAPQRLSCRQEREIFNFPTLRNLKRSLAFKRLDKDKEIIWRIKVECIL